jgi:hypothetical protein
MDYHETLKIAGGLLALLLFIPMIASILKEGVEGQSCAMWALWGVLDTILTISLAKSGGNYWLPLGFTIGDVALVILLMSKWKLKWSWFETVILAMVVACMIAWKMGGPVTAAISSTLAICVAAIPGFVAMLKNPQPKVGNVWAAYVVANGLSFFGGTAMIIKERFAPGAFALCSLAMFAASRARLRERNQRTRNNG